MHYDTSLPAWYNFFLNQFLFLVTVLSLYHFEERSHDYLYMPHGASHTPSQKHDFLTNVY